MIALICFALAVLASPFKSNIRLEAENAVLRHQLALERAPAGSVFNGAHGSAPRLVEIARAASELGGAGGRVAAWPLDEARKVLWGFADAIASDQIISGEKAKRELGWNPSRASIIDECALMHWRSLKPCT